MTPQAQAGAVGLYLSEDHPPLRHAASNANNHLGAFRDPCEAVGDVASSPHVPVCYSTVVRWPNGGAASFCVVEESLQPAAKDLAISPGKPAYCAADHGTAGSQSPTGPAC